MARIKDSTAVRPGEELDVAAIAQYLNAHLPSELLNSRSASVQVEQFPGGHSNLTYLLRYGDSEFVLRRPPVGPVAPTAHDMPREFKLLSTINPEFPFAPKPILLCEDTSVIGVPFYLMERRRGFIVRSNEPEGMGGNANWRRQLSESIVDTLVALHRVDIHVTGIVKFGKPDGFVARQVNGWAERWRRSKTSDVPEMEQTIDWLSRQIPDAPADQATIVHNDFKLDNIMLDEDDPTRVVAVLDWEMCAVGDPLVDLGLFLTYWTMKGSDTNSSLRAITNGPGWLTREQIVDRYARATGRDVSRIQFYEVFARFKIAVVIQQIYFRYVRKQTTDERFKNLDRLVLDLSRDAAGLVGRTPV